MTRSLPTIDRPRRPLPVPVTDAVPRVGALRIAAVWGLPPLLAESGLELPDVLDSAAVRPDVFDDPDNLVTYLQVQRLLLECERRLDCDHFGFLVGQRSRLANMGLAGRIATCADTAGAGLRRFVEHFNLHDSAATVSVVTSNEYTRFIYAISEPGMADTRHFQLGGITIAFNIMQDLCGPDWLPNAVTFATRKPSNPRPLQKFFRAPLHFDRDESALVFDRGWLNRPLPAVTGTVQRAVEAEVCAQRAAILMDIPATVRRILRKQLLLGKVSMEDIAAQVAMHRRTLDRLLQSHGIRYGELSERVRFDVARQLLLDSEISVHEIAESLRYSSPANFATAFRRWSGTTPTEFRRRRGPLTA